MTIEAFMLCCDPKVMAIRLNDVEFVRLGVYCGSQGDGLFLAGVHRMTGHAN